MFTGLIQDVGRVVSLRQGELTRLEVETKLAVEDVALGESIAVDGCCLTVAKQSPGRVRFEASMETLRRTVIEGYVPGAKVNLERAMALGERLGGHLVQGHVDGTGRILKTWSEGGSRWLEVELPAALAPFFIEKGSVAVDGVSLTVNTLGADRFGLTLIPETVARTTLARKPVGARVNLEADLIGKYVARMMSLRGSAKLDEKFLDEAGFRGQQ